MAHELSMNIIAEGIEDEEQLGLIQELNCEYAQGYLFSKPLDSLAAEQYLINTKT